MSRISDNTSSYFSKDETYYEILGIGRNATLLDITNSYNKLINKWNPHKNINQVNKGASTNRKFLDINNAYQVLSNTDTKRKYDYSLENGIKFKHVFIDPFDVYNEFQRIKKDVRTKFKNKLEDILDDYNDNLLELNSTNQDYNQDYSNIKYKNREIIERQLILINNEPFEKIIEKDDNDLIYTTYIHSNGMKQSVMSDDYLNFIIDNGIQ